MRPSSGDVSSAPPSPSHPFPKEPPPEGDLPPMPETILADRNLPETLRKLTGISNLSSLRSLKFTASSQVLSLHRLSLFAPQLSDLDLKGSSLKSLRDLGCGLTSLRILDVSDCGLDSLDGLFGLDSLLELRAADNKITDIGMCSYLPDVRRLDVQRNAVEDLTQLLLLAICPDLRHLRMEGCPATRVGDYQAAVRRMLPELVTLDGRTLGTPQQRWHSRKISRGEGEDVDWLQVETSRSLGTWEERNEEPRDSARITTTRSLGAGEERDQKQQGPVTVATASSPESEENRDQMQLASPERSTGGLLDSKSETDQVQSDFPQITIRSLLDSEKEGDQLPRSAGRLLRSAKHDQVDRGPSKLATGRLYSTEGRDKALRRSSRHTTGRSLDCDKECVEARQASSRVATARSMRSARSPRDQATVPPTEIPALDGRRRLPLLKPSGRARKEDGVRAGKSTIETARDHGKDD